MSSSLGILAVSAFLASNMAMLTVANAADTGEPPPVAKVLPNANKSVSWRESRNYVWRAPGELIAGVQGASPLTVPFYGSGWYPGPAHYYSPRPVLCCRAGVDAVISVRY
jgi:hypothetical protein